MNINNWKQLEKNKYNWLYQEGYGVGQPLRCVKKYNLSPNLSCIDLGCGRASLSSYFKSYTGVDISDYIIEKNKKNKEGSYYCTSLDNLECIQNSYDIAICSDVMEHIPSDQLYSVLSSIAKLNVQVFYFVISTRKSVILDQYKNNLHLSIFPANIWRDKINMFFTIDNEEILPTLYTIKCFKK